MAGRSGGKFTSEYGDWREGSEMNDKGGELAFIEWLRRQTPAVPSVTVGPGDDASVLAGTGDANLIVTTDMLLEGSCFQLSKAGPRRVGRKAFAVNLSDLAAMAARPLAAVVSVGLPRDGGAILAKELFLGMKTIADEYQVPIVGGDTNSWNGPLTISVTMLGTATANGTVLRNGAKPGDCLFVTGPLGGSILGHHLDFTPRVREALALHQLVDVHAMIDISDGFALDLHRLCRESGCGAEIDAQKIPIAAAAYEMNDEAAPIQHALSDGEDFELLFAVSMDDAEVLLRQTQIPVFAVGRCVEQGMSILMDGAARPLVPLGYEHKFA
jgi:thiamine-monophosphate kinase